MPELAWEFVRTDDGGIAVHHPDGVHRVTLAGDELHSPAARERAQNCLPPEVRPLFRAAVEAAAGPNRDGWGLLPDLDRARPVDFPIDALPEAVAEPVGEIARFTQTPVEAVAAVALGALSTAARGAFSIRISGTDIEPASLYLLIAMVSGARKSAIYAHVNAPFEVWEETGRQRVAPMRAAKLAERKALEAALRKAQRDGGEVEAAAEAVAACRVPALPRLTANNVTMEKLGVLMAEHDGVMALNGPEAGAILGIIGGRYQNGTTNFEELLHGYTGEAVTVDRVGREAVIVRRAHLTVCLMLQPELLHSFLANPAYRDRGLVSRFLYVQPASNIGTRLDEPEPIASGVLAAWGDVMARVLGASATGHELTLAPAAYRVLRTFYEDTERAMAEGGPLERLRDWGSKARGQVARIAALLHLAQHAGRSPLPVAVDESTMIDAVELGTYFREVARQLLTSEDAVAQDARRVVAWLRRTGPPRITARDASRACDHTGRRGPEEWRAVLEELAEVGVLQEVEVERPRGGRRTQWWAVHPDVSAVSSDSRKAI